MDEHRKAWEQEMRKKYSFYSGVYDLPARAVIMMDINDVYKEAQQEICICAAMQWPDGFIVRGQNHAECIRHAVGRTPPMKVSEAEQGFLTSWNRFVDRYEGLKLQLMARIPSKDPSGYKGEKLYSEDLY